MVRKKYETPKNRQVFKTIKIIAIVFLMCATVIDAQRTDHEEIHTSYSDMDEYTIRFYDIVGNDSTLCFDSDAFGTHIFCLNGTTGNATFYGNVLILLDLIINDNVTADFYYGNGSKLSGLNITEWDTAYDWGDHSLAGYLTSAGNPFNQDLNTTDNASFTWLDITNGINASYFAGDGGNLTNLNASNLTGTLNLNPFDQWLNTTDNATFWNITATQYFIGNGSLLTGILPSNMFNQDLNTTDSPTFAGLTLTGFNGFLKAVAGVVGTSAITVADITDIATNYLKLDGSNANQNIDIGIYNFTTTGNITAGAFFGEGGNLTGLPSGFTYSDWFNQQLNTTDDVTFNSIAGDGSALTNLNASNLTGILLSNPFNQWLNTTDNATFIWLDVTNGINASYFAGDGGNLTNITETDPVYLDDPAFNITDGNISNWDTAFGWGDHSVQNYLDLDTFPNADTDSTDDLVDGDFGSAGLMKTDGAGVYWSITDNHTEWDTAYDWGDHSLVGYLTSAGNPFNQDLNTTDNATFTWLDVTNGINASYFAGDGGNLTNVTGDGYAGGKAHPHNQDLNTTSSPTFDIITASNYYGVITNIFDNDLNQSDSPTFDDITLSLYPNLDKDSTDDNPNLFNQWLNTTDNATFTWLDVTNGINASYFAGDGGNLTNVSGIYWDRSDTTVYPSTDGDAVQINSTLYTTGNITMEGNRTINATENITIGNPGDIIIGDDTERDMYPNTTGKINLGRADRRFNNGWFSGKLTVTGGVDPPYVLFNRETLSSILNRINLEIPKNEDIKWNGQVIYYDGEEDAMFALNPKSGHREQFVWKSEYDTLEERVERLEMLIQELL